MAIYLYDQYDQSYYPGGDFTNALENSILPYSLSLMPQLKLEGVGVVRLLVKKEILPHLTTLVSALEITYPCRESHRVTNLTEGKCPK